MKFSYNPLWKLLIDKGLNKAKLREMTGISSASIAKLGKGDNVTTDILHRICVALDCNLHDIVEIVEEQKKDDLQKFCLSSFLIKMKLDEHPLLFSLA